MEEEAQSETAQILSEALYRVGEMGGFVMAYTGKDDTVHFRYKGGRVLCRGLVEEMADFLCSDLQEAEVIDPGEEE